MPALILLAMLFLLRNHGLRLVNAPLTVVAVRRSMIERVPKETLMTRTTSVLAIALCGVWGSALACGDAPMSMKDAAVASPAVVASVSKTTPAQPVAKTAPVAKAATTPVTKVAQATQQR
jgi:hypothetical protein